MSGSLAGQVALVTGASGDIGASVARTLAAAGAGIVLHHHQGAERVHALADELSAVGGRAVVVGADLQQAAACARLVHVGFAAFGRLDVVVNNAGGIIGPKPFAELDHDSWAATMMLNAGAPLFVAQAAFELMHAAGGGRIINISSVSAKYGGSATTLHYGCAKAAVEALTVGLARLGAPRHILVNCVRAGFIDTRLHVGLGRTSTDDRVALIPLERAGQPIDVARAVHFLASNGGNFITGQILSVTGGE